MEIIQEFFGAFNELTKQDWRDILIMLGVASLLSFIIGWLLRSFKVRSLKRLLTDKESAYNTLNIDYKDNLSLLSTKEDEHSSLNRKVTSLNEELKGLRLKLTSKELTPAIVGNMDIEDEAVEVELDEDNTSKLGWLDKIKGAFSSKTAAVNGVDVEEDLSISLEEKLEATNNMVDRLLTSNEKMEDENSELKLKIIELENKPIEAKPVVVPEPVQKIVVNQPEVAQYTKSLTEARITGTDLLKRIQTLEVYNGKVIKQLEEANKVKEGVELKLKGNGDFKFKYDEVAAKFEQSKIENIKLVADLQKVSSTAKQDTFEVELKSKSALLDQCAKERTLLESKLKTLTETINDSKPVISNKSATDTVTPLKKEQEEKSFKFAGLQTNKESEAKKALANKFEAEKKTAALKAEREEAERKAAAQRKEEEEERKAIAERKAEEAKQAEALKAKQEEAKRLADLKAKEDTAKREAELKLKQEAATKKADKLNVTKESTLDTNALKPDTADTNLSHDIITRIKSKAASIDFGRIGTGNAAQKDDLKKIKGIGEFVEKKLNALGVYHYKQVAIFNDNDIEKINDAIEFFPGRIQRDNWVGQAKMLYNNNRRR